MIKKVLYTIGMFISILLLVDIITSIYRLDTSIALSSSALVAALWLLVDNLLKK